MKTIKIDKEYDLKFTAGSLKMIFDEYKLKNIVELFNFLADNSTNPNVSTFILYSGLKRTYSDLTVEKLDSFIDEYITLDKLLPFYAEVFTELTESFGVDLAKNVKAPIKKIHSKKK